MVGPGIDSRSEARPSTRRRRSSSLTRLRTSPSTSSAEATNGNLAGILLERRWSWDRNDDAGILNRFIAHAGVGNKWVDTVRRRFTTSYGFSYSDREEEAPDPEKDRRFAGGRLGWEYIERFDAGTTFDNKFATNINLPMPPTTR